MRSAARTNGRAPRRGLSAPRRARPNVSRRAAAARRRERLGRLAACLQGLAAAAVVVFASCFFVFVHDMFVQSEYFKARTLTVEGARRLPRRDILAQAGIREGANVLGVNLTAARSRLLAHPWIAEAEVRREIPATLRIRIREHVPAAVVDVGAKFLLNEQGDVFKEWEASDPAGLPVVRGLAVQDLRVADRSGAASSDAPLAYLKLSPAPAPLLSRAMEAVSQVLALGREPGGVLPARQVAAIRVDPELGLTVEAFEPVKSIRLGYDDYREKYRLLGELKTFLLKQADFNDFERIDLNDVHRVIINPARSVSRLAGR